MKREDQLVLNRTLYTRDGSLMGNAIITKIVGNVYTVVTDYGNAEDLTAGQIYGQFSVGPINATHKHAVAVPSLGWLEVARLVRDRYRQNTGNDVNKLTDTEILTLITRAYAEHKRARAIMGAIREEFTSPPDRMEREEVWSRGARVAGASSLARAAAQALRDPLIMGDPLDYAL